MSFNFIDSNSRLYIQNICIILLAKKKVKKFPQLNKEVFSYYTNKFFNYFYN